MNNVLAGYLLLICITTVSCAPVATLRTPQPLEAGQSRFSLGIGSPALAFPSPISRKECPGGCRGSAFLETEYSLSPQMLEMRWDFGVGSNTDVNISALLPMPQVRLGGKTQVLDGHFRIALDYGASLYALSNTFGLTWFPVGWGADAGVLWSAPLEGWEPYGSVRGYLTGLGAQPDFTFSTSVGVAFLGEERWFFELTLVAARATADRTLVWGWSPAIGFRF